jgi:hypothetical protein
MDISFYALCYMLWVASCVSYAACCVLHRSRSERSMIGSQLVYRKKVQSSHCRIRMEWHAALIVQPEHESTTTVDLHGPSTILHPVQSAISNDDVVSQNATVTESHLRMTALAPGWQEAGFRVTSSPWAEAGAWRPCAVPRFMTTHVMSVCERARAYSR